MWKTAIFFPTQIAMVENSQKPWPIFKNVKNRFEDSFSTNFFKQRHINRHVVTSLRKCNFTELHMLCYFLRSLRRPNQIFCDDNCITPVLWRIWRLIHLYCKEKAQDPKKTLLKVKINEDMDEVMSIFFIIQEIIYLCLKAYKQSPTRWEETVVWCNDFAPGFCIIKVTLLRCLKKLALIKSLRNNL